MYIFEYKHTVTFDETNLVGNVYFAQYFHWQGKCREDFIRYFSPSILDEITSGLCLVTTDSTCKFHKELFAFDEVLIEMPLTLLRKRRCRMGYSFYRVTSEGKELVAEGEQGVACLRKTPEGDILPEPFPEEFYTALVSYKKGERPETKYKTKQSEIEAY